MQIWDLRKTKKTLEVVPFDEGTATCATFDHSGKYLVRFYPKPLSNCWVLCFSLLPQWESMPVL